MKPWREQGTRGRAWRREDRPESSTLGDRRTDRALGSSPGSPPPGGFYLLHQSLPNAETSPRVWLGFRL